MVDHAWSMKYDLRHGKTFQVIKKDENEKS